jgi:hypothetical protein
MLEKKAESFIYHFSFKFVRSACWLSCNACLQPSSCGWTAEPQPVAWYWRSEAEFWQWALHTAANTNGGMPNKLWTAYQAKWIPLHTNSNKPPVLLLPHYTERGEFSARLPFISGEKGISPHSLRQEWRTSGNDVARPSISGARWWLNSSGS